MEVLLYGSFAYLIIRMFKWSFKKGEQTKNEWDTYEKTTFKRFISIVYHVKVLAKSPFSKKHRLILKEFKKDYKEHLSQELIEVVARKALVEEVSRELTAILEHKEWKEYNKFKFDDSIHLSRRQQFLEIRMSFEEECQLAVQRVVKVMLKNNLMNENELKFWNSFFELENIKDENGVLREIELPINNDVSEGIPDVITTRTVDNEKSKRF